MIMHGCREFIRISQFHVKCDFIRVERHAIESDIAKRAIAKVGRYSAAVARPDKHIMGVGHGPVVHRRRPTAVGLSIMINPNYVVGAVHDKCEVHPLPCRHRDTRIDRQGMTRGRSGRIKSQRLAHTARPKELISRAFVTRTLHRHIALAHIAWIAGISLVAHPSRDREALVGSNIEVFVMRNDHILVSSVKRDVMGRLGKSSRQGRQQNSENKELLHGDRCYTVKRQCIAGQK